jgi:diaminohydroxyphosphoribosylaminopyrimidine deaminase/5-amino-6-(5-phosphoribosylamino)uracil reductase
MVIKEEKLALEEAMVMLRRRNWRWERRWCEFGQPRTTSDERRITSDDQREEHYMRRALNLAKQGQGITYPNPMVGAVIVKNGQIIGEGWHRGPGQAHAEVDALRHCRAEPHGATLFVTLEPCNHYGRTPPCTEAIITAGIGEVQYALPDPNPAVSGKGAERLRAAGIRAEAGLLKSEAIELNRMFLRFCLTGRPWVILKAALSLDAKIASAGGKSKWITGAAARAKVHQLRAEVGAVLIGSGTLRADDPRLTSRLDPPATRQPLKVLLDSKLALAATANLISYEPEKLLVFCNRSAAPVRIQALSELGAQVLPSRSGEQWILTDLLATLGELGVQSLLIEGGSGIYSSFVDADLVDEYYLFYAPFFMGGGGALPVIDNAGIDAVSEARRIKIDTVELVGPDVLIHAYKEELTRCLPV